MKKILISTCLFIFIIGCQTNQQQESDTENLETIPEEGLLTPQEKEAGWQLLFDGKTKNGWHIYNNQTAGTAWEVGDGILHLNPKEM